MDDNLQMGLVDQDDELDDVALEGGNAEVPIMINKIVKKVQKKKGKKALTSVKSPEPNQEDIDEEDGQTNDLGDITLSKTQSYNVAGTHYMSYDNQKNYRSRSKSDSKDQDIVEKKLDMDGTSETGNTIYDEEANLQQNDELSLREEKTEKQSEDFPELDKEGEFQKELSITKTLQSSSVQLDLLKTSKKSKESNMPSTKKGKHPKTPKNPIETQTEEEYSIPELIPMELVVDFSPLEKMLLSKFKAVPDSEPANGLGILGNRIRDQKKYNQSCLRIVSLIKNFLEEEQVVEPEEPEKEYKREEKETAETETKPKTKNEDFKLFNQYYKLRVESKPTRLNKINLGRTHNSKIKIDKPPINEQSYSYKSKQTP